MKKTLLILFMLVMVLCVSLTITATCFAEETTEATEVVEEATADNNVGVWFKTMWEKCKEWAIGAFSGVSVSALVGGIVVVAVKKASSAGFDKIEKATNSTTIADATSEKLLNNLSSVALDVNIKPLMEWEYKKLYQQVNGNLEISLNKQDQKNLATLECFEAFANFFKNSTVPEADKQALSDAIANAKALYETHNTAVKATIEVNATPTTKEVETTNTVAENY